MIVTVVKVGDGWHTRDFEVFETTPDVFLRIKQWLKARISAERNADLMYIQRAIHSAADADDSSMLKERLVEKDQEYNSIFESLNNHTFGVGSDYAFHYIHTYIIEQKPLL